MNEIVLQTSIGTLLETWSFNEIREALDAEEEEWRYSGEV